MTVSWNAKVFVPMIAPAGGQVWYSEKGMRLTTIHFGTNLLPINQPTFPDGTSDPVKFVLRPVNSAEDMFYGRFSKVLPGVWVPKSQLSRGEDGSIDAERFVKRDGKGWRR